MRNEGMFIASLAISLMALVASLYLAFFRARNGNEAARLALPPIAAVIVAATSLVIADDRLALTGQIVLIPLLAMTAINGLKLMRHVSSQR